MSETSSLWSSLQRSVVINRLEPPIVPREVVRMTWHNSTWGLLGLDEWNVLLQRSVVVINRLIRAFHGIRRVKNDRFPTQMLINPLKIHPMRFDSSVPRYFIFHVGLRIDFGMYLGEIPAGIRTKWLQTCKQKYCSKMFRNIYRSRYQSTMSWFWCNRVVRRKFSVLGEASYRWL